MKTTDLFFNRELRFQGRIADGFAELIQLKAQENRRAFNEKLLPLLAEVKRYLIRGLRLALSKGVISHNKYRPEDFFDQLFLEVYDAFDEIPNPEEFRVWLFGRAEALLQDMEIQEISETFMFDNLDSYSRAEDALLEESYTTDGDGDRIMMDELDDISYQNHRYLLANIFLDDEQEIMNLVDSNPKQLNYNLEEVLFELPPDERSVFELAVEQGFEELDIARIKNTNRDQVHNLLEAARTKLYTILSERVFNP